MASPITETREGEQIKELKPLEKQKTLEHFNRRMGESEDRCKKYWDRCEENQQFTYGFEYQWQEKVYDQRRKSSQPAFSVNDIALAVNALSGRELVQRFQQTYLARTKEDQPFANVCREFTRFMRDGADADHVESDCFRDMGIQGMSWVEWDQDQTENVIQGGKAAVEGVDSWEMMWDASSRKACLEDRMWDARGKFASFDETLTMFPEDAEKIVKATNDDRMNWVNSKDQESHRWPWLYRGEGKFVKPRTREIFVVDYQWKEKTDGYVIQTFNEDKTPGEVIEMTADEMKDARPRLIKMGITHYVPVPKWVYKRAWVVGNTIINEEEIKVGAFTRVPMTGFPFKQFHETRHYGLVDLMRDPQMFKNSIFSMAVSILQHAPKGPIFYEARTFKNPQEAVRKVAKIPGAMVEMRPGGKDTLVFGPTPQWPTGLDSYFQRADEAIWKPTGFSPASLGMMQDVRRVSGTVVSSLQQASMMTLSYLFDTLRKYRKITGRLMLKHMDAYYGDDYIARVVGPELMQLTNQTLQASQTTWNEAMQVDVVVEEAPVSPSEQMEAWDFLTRTDFIGNMVSSGMMPPHILIRMMPGLNTADKAEWLSYMQSQEQAAGPTGAPQGGMPGGEGQVQ